MQSGNQTPNKTRGSLQLSRQQAEVSFSSGRVELDQDLDSGTDTLLNSSLPEVSFFWGNRYLIFRPDYCA